MNKRWLKIRTLLLTMVFFAPYAAIVLFAVPLGSWALVAITLLVPAVFLVGQYWSGKKFAMRSVQAEDYNDPLANDMVRRLSKEMDVPEPDLKIGYFGAPNAFACGRKGNGVVVLSYSLIELLDVDEIEAIIAHEISHLESRDVEVMLLGQSLDVLVYRAMEFATHNVQGIVGMLFGAVVVLIGSIIRATILVPLRFISRYREYVADYDAGKYTENPEALASALEKIEHFHCRESTPEPAEAVNALCIFSVERSLTERLLGTHPPINKRARRLRDQQEEMNESESPPGSCVENRQPLKG